MPSYNPHIEIPLDEALEYFTEYAKRVNPETDIGFLLSLTSFIAPDVRKEIYDNLTQSNYIVVAKRYQNDYRLKFYKNNDDEICITNEQIKVLQDLRSILISEKAKNSLNRYYNRNKKIFFIVVIILAILYVKFFVINKYFN